MEGLVFSSHWLDFTTTTEDTTVCPPEAAVMKSAWMIVFLFLTLEQTREETGDMVIAAVCNRVTSLQNSTRSHPNALVGK